MYTRFLLLPKHSQATYLSSWTDAILWSGRLNETVQRL